MLRWLTAGESHGPSLTAILEGLPAGVPVTGEAIRRDLARRRLGAGRGSRQKFEQDELGVVGGVVHGRTIGAPIALTIGNTEWPKWSEVMNAEDVPLTDASRGRSAPLTRPRPGHADLTGMQKYGFDEARPVLERASARETAARVALGAVARAFLAELGIGVVSHVVSIGPIAVPEEAAVPRPADVDVPLPDAVRGAPLLDVAYSPWPTAIGARWLAAGGRLLHGLDMLVEQAVLQVRVFTDADPDAPLPREDEVRAAMRAAVSARAAGRGRSSSRTSWASSAAWCRDAPSAPPWR